MYHLTILTFAINEHQLRSVSVVFVLHSPAREKREENTLPSCLLKSKWHQGIGFLFSYKYK